MKHASRRNAPQPAVRYAKAQTLSISMMASVNNPPFGCRRVDYFVPAQAPKHFRASDLSDSVNFPVFNYPAPVLNLTTT
jgi:hypothetical protein